jgi:hypothetical protein
MSINSVIATWYGFQKTLVNYFPKLVKVLLLTISIELSFSQVGILAEILQWQPAPRVAPITLIQQVIQNELPSYPVNPNQLHVLKIHQMRQVVPLYIIDLRIYPQENEAKEPLCGSAGCFNVGYIPTSNQRYQRVFGTYLTRLPQGYESVTPTNQLKYGLPCLRFNRLKGNQVHSSLACFNGQQYIEQFK